ncbi:hypothetical protein, partial [Streptomyces sp. NPDC004658]|uniref:hypothetical protein n=1 Tax=Streptomyces sp. NPDC004658 TaxID=3154672 RepID=UPI0033A9ADE9
MTGTAGRGLVGHGGEQSALRDVAERSRGTARQQSACTPAAERSAWAHGAAPAAHDLVRLAAPADLRPVPCTGSQPAWVRDSLVAAPWAVVRRAPAPPGLVPVGVRGAGRG